jgi:hypothetical protein
MPQANVDLLAFNRGLISPLALARTDVERIRLSAETMVNWTPKTQGAMRLRAGLGYIGASASDNPAMWIPFVASTTDTALLEITDLSMRVWIDDALLTRASVSSTVTTGDFSSSTGWTEDNAGGGGCSFGGSGLTLNATSRGGRASCHQSVSTSSGGTEHALRIVVARGPVTFKCGSVVGRDDYISETTLREGIHSLAFTPSSAYVVQFLSSQQVDRIVTSIAVESSGVVTIPAPWVEADLDLIRPAQSADVVFVACQGYRQRRIERRGTGRSWSLVKYYTDKGPFRGKTADGVLLKVAKTYGNTTLTADRSFFTQNHVGAIFRLFHNGAKGTFILGGNNQFIDPFLVSGITPDNVRGDTGHAGGRDRYWTYSITGTWSGTITMQRSLIDRDFGYVDAPQKATPHDTGTVDTGANHSTIAANQSETMDDGQDNVDYYYRMGFKGGDYTSGSATVEIDYPGDGDYGICRVVTYNSATSVAVEVLQDFRDTTYTDDWVEGSWSDVWGYPTAVALFNGRLWWTGGAQLYGSVSDDYHNFDPTTEGDAGPINRTIGEGPVDTINFMLPLQRLLLGTAGNEISVKSTTFDEPITPGNINAKEISTQGSAALPAVRVDNRGIYVQRSLKRVFELLWQLENNDHGSADLTALNPDIAADTTITGIAVQRQPDTRVHFTMADGTVAMLSYQPVDQLLCWSKVSSLGAGGIIEKVVILPGTPEDQVYYHVKRTINGGTVRYLEKQALESETVGGAVTKLADSFIVVEGVSGTTVTGLSHVEGEGVVVWAEGKYQGEYTVLSGAITLDNAVTNADVVVGLGYTAQYKSTKLAYAAGRGTALVQRKRVNYIGLILADTHYQGLEYGRDFDNMDPLPAVRDGATVSDDTIHDAWDLDMTPFPGEWNTDSRLCLRATAPKPVTVLAAVLSVNTSDKV